MFKSLSGLFSSAPAFPYVLDEPYEGAWGEEAMWTHYRGHAKEDNAPVSIFKTNPSSLESSQWQCAKNGARRLKMLRHPNVLEYKYSVEMEQGEKSGGGPVLYIVTEAVAPLETKLKELALDGKDRDQYMAVGMNQITKAISFMNNDCRLIHGNVRHRAVVVTATLDWKLHGFDLCSEHDKVDEEGTLQVGHAAVPDLYKPEELRKGEFSLIKRSPPWAVDAWGLGCFWMELFTGRELASMNELRDVGSLPEAVVKDYQRLLASNPARRLNPAKVLETNEYFQNKLLDTCTFLESLALKDSAEKDTFFRKLTPVVKSMCKPIAQNKVLPLLGNALVFGSAPAVALTPFLLIARTLPADLIKTEVMPTVVKLFASQDRALRVQLLQNMEFFVEHMDADVLDQQVFPQVLTGYTDSTAYVRELTLKCTPIMAPKLQQKTINQNLLKFLSKLQVDEEQAIRANTTICLGNLARYMGEQTCKRVLLNAFTRALKDTFPPTRAASMMAMVATAEYYDASEMASRILPQVSPLAIDADQDVRENAFKCLDCFLGSLRRYSQRVTTGDTTSAPLVKPAPANEGLLGWAVKSIATRMGGPAAAEKEEGAESTSASADTETRAKGSAASPPDAPSPPTAQMEAMDMGGEGDGWDDGEDEELAQQLAEEAAARSKLRTPTHAHSAPTLGADTKFEVDDNQEWGGKDVGTANHAASTGPVSTTITKTSSASTPRPAGRGAARPPSAVRPGSAGVARKPAGPSKLATAPKPKLGAAKLTAKGGNADFDWGSFLDE